LEVEKGGSEKEKVTIKKELLACGGENDQSPLKRGAIVVKSGGKKILVRTKGGLRGRKFFSSKIKIRVCLQEEKVFSLPQNARQSQKHSRRGKSSSKG